MNKKLVTWILEHTDDWKQNRDDNYLPNWNRYERVWRGVWDGADKHRESERSKIISPATQQAIESHTSEIEEALWGAGADLFDIEDDVKDQDKTDIEFVKAYMKECFKKNKLRKSVSDVLLMASIYGTGIGEIVIKEVEELVPATQPMPDIDATAVGTESSVKVVVTLNPINPRNFIIDPTSSTIEDALGVAIEEFVSAHIIAKAVEDGTYLETDVAETTTTDIDLEPNNIDDPYHQGKVKVLRYYGLVPEALLNEDEDEIVELFEEDEDKSLLLKEYGNLVEAIVVIANDSELLKAELSPYMMKDRPIVAFQDDTVPGKFYGRGIAEKGYNMQMGMDALLRSEMDSLALTTVPMMAMDATRMPRGAKFEIRPGKTILTNGNPNEILLPFKFGQTDGSNAAAAANYERMLLQATGTLDTTSMQTQPVGGVMSIALSGIIKKNKKTLVNFQETFLIPFIEKSAWRFMQFDAENFPVKDFKFVPAGSLGMLAREVEQLQFINLMKTLGPDSPLMPILMQGVIKTSSLPNKEQLLKQIEASGQPDPQAEQLQQMEQQLMMQNAQLDLAGKEAEVMKTKAETESIVVDTQLRPKEAEAKIMQVLTTNLNEDDEDKSFAKRVQIAELMLKEADLDQNMKVVELQMSDKNDAK